MKVIAFHGKKSLKLTRKDLYQITRDNLEKYFIEIEPTYINLGTEIAYCKTFMARALSEFEKETQGIPVIEIDDDKHWYISIDKAKELNLIAS